MIEIIILIGAILLGIIISYLCLRPALKVVNKENTEIAQKNADLHDENLILNQTNHALQEQKEIILASIDDLKGSLSSLEDQAKQAAQIFYDKNLQIAQEHFAAAAEEERQKYLTAVADYNKQLAIAMEEGVSAYVKEIAEYEKNYNKISEMFTDLKASTDAAVAAAKRAEEIKEEANFYKIQLSDLDIEEIQMLRNITPYLRDKEPLNKVIWKTYYEKPTTDLIGRVIGLGVHSGIYKITNLDNNKCYVGQAVNLADRWKQHIKRGLGAETPTKNKLYPAMIASGVENFSFEVIEECPRDKLDDREDYWQEYFKAKEFGYSIK